MLKPIRLSLWQSAEKAEPEWVMKAVPPDRIQAGGGKPQTLRP